MPVIAATAQDPVVRKQPLIDRPLNPTGLIAGALVGNVLSEQMLEPPAVVIEAQLEMTANRSLWMRALVLALDVVVVPDDRFELLSAWARQH